MNKKALRCKKFFDSNTGEVLNDITILVEDDKIAAVGPSANYANTPDYEVIDLYFAAPGMIDCHIHGTANGEAGNLIPRAYQTFGEVAMKSLRCVQDDLMAGFTSVRMCGDYGFNDVGLRDTINSGLTFGPRIFATCSSGFSAEHLNPYLVEHAHNLQRQHGPTGMRRAVRMNIKMGADFIKLANTGSVLGLGSVVNSRQKTYEEVCAIIDTAKMYGKTTACHAHPAEGVKDAVRAGVTSIEHGTLMDEECVQMLKEHGTYLVPTLIAPERAATVGKANGTPDWAVAKAVSVMEHHAKIFKRCVDEGIKIAFGTDAATAGNYHGKQTHEFELMVQNGMTPIQALTSATKTASHLLTWEDKVGSIEPGKFADVVAYDSDPTEDISVMNHCSFVMKGGELYKKDGVALRR